MPRKTIKWSGGRKPPRNRIQNNDSEDDSGFLKKNGGKDWEVQEMLTNDLEELKNK